MSRNLYLGASLLALQLALPVIGQAQSVQPPTPPAQQVPSETQTASVQEVVVTGTNIKSAAAHAAVSNVVTIGSEQIQASGALQAVDLIKQMPWNAGTTQYNENGQLYGTAQFELRGLGFSSTLVLLNGRRAGVAPLSDKSGASFVDVNQFPLAMVDHIDVLKDGSSAIYGSEAVAGVVNIVTRKGYDGLELSADFASSSNDAYSVNLAAGRKFDRGSFNIYATYYNQTGNFRSDFPWLIQRVGGNGNPALGQLINNNGYPGSFQLATLNASGKPTAVTGAVSVPDPNCQAAGGVFPISSSGVVNSSVCDINFTNQVAVIPAEERIQAFFEGAYDFNSHVSYFNETSVSRNVSKVAETVGSYSNGSAVNGLSFVPANAPFNFFIADPNNPKKIIAVDPSQWNPAVDQAVSIVGNFRPQGPYSSGRQQQIDTYIRTVNGVDFSLGHGWSGAASHEFAYGQYELLNPLSINASNLNNLIASGQYNPFGTAIVSPTLVSPKNGVSVAGNSQAVLNQIFFTSDLRRTTEENVVDLGASGPLVQLPSGLVSAAVGAQYRTESLSYTPDSLTAAGLANASTTDASYSGYEHVWSAYGELMVPLWDVAEIQAALRHEDYGGAIGSTTNPKVTARVHLFDRQLTLRASGGTSFQAPALTQQVSTQTISLINDPVAASPSGLTCSTVSTGTGTTVITTGGGLRPQSSTNYDFGADARIFPGAAISVDYWHYDYSNLIAAGANAQAIVNGECVNGKYVADPRVNRLSNGLLSTVTSPFVNVGKVIVDGVDLSGTYNRSLDQYGAVSARLDAVYLDRFDAYNAAGVVAHRAGSRNFSNNFAPAPRWRGSAHATWTMGVNELTVGINYIGSYRNDQSPQNARIDSFTTLDLQYSLRLDPFLHERGAQTLFTVGVNNAFDAAPPALTDPSAIGGSDRPGYDPLSGANIQGRTIYVRLKQNF